MSRVLFLDIDGVITTNRTYNLWRKAGCGDVRGLFDPECVALVNALTDAIGASIVVASDWKHPDTCREPVAGVLRDVGITAPILGVTPCLCRRDGTLLLSGHRGHEIAVYILTAGLPLADVVILDDNVRAGQAPPGMIRQGARFIPTPTATGLTRRHVERAVALFGVAP